MQARQTNLRPCLAIKVNNMNIRIVKHNPASIKSWGSGAGKVCEIYRFPEAATDESYMVRFSTATIEVPQSDFTLYPGYIRHHRTLKGLCVFNIKGVENTTLIDQSGTVFDFFGESQLRCSLTTDSAFATNLIHHPQVYVNDRVLQISTKNISLEDLFQLPLVPPTKPQVLLNIVYVIEGELTLGNKIAGEQAQNLTQGDALIASQEGMNSGGPRWDISSSTATIYHGVIAIPQSC
jgi:environmental stress-induced protein Ves